MAEWKMVKGHLCRETRYPGVWSLKDGRYWIRARAKSPKHGRLAEVNRVIDAATAAEASEKLQELLAPVRSGSGSQKTGRQRFNLFAASLFKAKVAAGEINGRASRKAWQLTLENHLIPQWGDWYLDQIRTGDVLDWRAALAARVQRGEYLPTTVNMWLSKFKVIMRAAIAKCELEHDCTRGAKPLDTSTHRTYTREQPNSLTNTEVRTFLDEVLERNPQHYAMLVTGFSLALRPSSLRPLRRKGPTPEVLWEEKTLLIRRSHTLGDDIGEFTKTKKDLEIGITEELVELLEWHAATWLKTPAQKDSDLLFPAPDGDLWNESTIGKLFNRVSRRLQRKVPGWTKRITPRSMRRTFYNLVDMKKVADAQARLISGHATARMADRYRTAQTEQQREVVNQVGQVIDLAGVRQRRARQVPPTEGQVSSEGAR